MRKPRVDTRCPAAEYTDANERIVEIDSDAGGFLLSLWVNDSGALIVEPYRADKTVIVRVPERQQQPWINGPEISSITFEHGQVAGTVRIAFTDYGRVFVSTDAHVNDDAPAVTFRGTEYLISLHATRSDDGSWSEYQPEPWDIRKRHVWPDGYATPTYRQTIVSALLQVVSEHWSEETGRLAGYARAARDLNHADLDYNNARTMLHGAQDTVNEARARMESYRPSA